ncbi:MAG: fasciclin domain-containing protein, partial [Bacteroidota bacterium]
MMRFRIYRQLIPKIGLLMLAIIFSSHLSAQYRVTIENGGTTIGPFSATPAAFGSVTSGCGDEVVGMGDTPIDFETGDPTLCNGASGAVSVEGKIAFIDRGGCEFGQKCLSAQRAGAIAVVVCNNVADPPTIIMAGGAVGDQVTIPCFMVSQEDCVALRAALEGGTVTLEPDLPVFNEDDRVIWGDVEGQGDFSGGFNDWATVGVTTMFGEQETVPVEWQWGTEFPAPLAPPAIEAPSTCDGSVIFDSQSLIDLESDDPLSFYAGFLISPVLDLSASVDPILSFYQFHIPLNGVAAVQYTVDGGESFSEFIIVDTENELNSNVTNIVGTELVEIPYPELAGESQVQFLFLCISDAYFWVVDDVRVIERNTLAADPTALNVGAMAGTDTVNIDANIAWTASVDEDWLTISPTSGSTDAQLVIEYQDNDSRRNSRTATITVSSNEGLVDPVTITVNQERLRNFVRVNPDTVTVDMLAGSTSFAVESDQLWSAAESESWLSISPNSGFGDGAVDVNYDENTADTARVGMIEVSSVSGSTAVFVLIQEGAGIQEMISADPTDINVDASAGEAEIRVSSNTNWVASGGDEWISYAPSTGEGDDVITVKYDENTALDSRQTSITLSTGAGEMVTVTITQAGAAPFIAVDPMMLNVGNGEGDASVAVNANENWTASSDSEWLIVTPEAGSGSTGAIVGYLENLSLDARTGTITFTAASGGIATVIVNQDGRPRTTVVDVVVNSDVHETLEAAVIAAELAGTLSGEGPFTVFAPTDDAFGALPEGTLETLLADPTGDLANILLYHVLGAKVLSTDLMDGQVATTLLGEDVTVTINEDGVFINDAQVTVADIETDNGVVHVIDAVLLPPPPLPATVVDIVVNSEVHETLEAAVIAAELADDLSGEGPFTVFAPTDDAFAALPEGTVETLLEDPTGDLANILLYHVLGAKVLSTDLMDGQVATTLLGEDITVTINEDGVFINDAQVTVADIEAENGVVHVIDAVLLPPPALPATVVDIIVESDVHETLEAAVIAAELADDLSGEGPFTVFAPTDDAFAALPEGTVEMLLEDPTGDLANILLYHVLGVKVLSTDLTDGQTAMTLEGSDITVTINDDGVFINGAQVIVADLEAENGVVHVIDAVLIPPVDCDEVVEGGTVALEDGTTEATIIAGDGQADVLSFMSMGAAEDANFTYVITDDQNTILGIPPSNMQDFEGAGPGICRVWGLSYTGEITAMGGDNAAEVDLSSECFELSSNFITVTREEFMLPATVVDIVVNSDVHNTLEAAVIAAELADDLSGEGPFTVFAPTDDAFAALPEGTVETLLEDPTGDLANILLYHVLGAKVLSTDLSDGQVATTLLGEDITVTINDDGVFINNAQVIVADLEAQNGVVHVIDAVLLPPDPCEGVVDGGTVALEDGSTEATVTVGDGVSDFLSFTSMGANADANFAYVITDDLNNILGIPDNNMADFDNAGPGVCRVWGLSYTGQVTALPGDNAGEVALSSECFALSSNFITVNREEFMLPATVVDIVVNSEGHETLEAAVIAAELADDLSGEGPFTVFAPTDDAFAALP